MTLQRYFFKLFIDINLTDRQMVVKHYSIYNDGANIMNTKNKKILVSTILLASIFGLVAVFAAATFDTDLQPIGYVGQPVVSSSIVSSGTEKMYAIDYSAFNWSGNIHSYTLTTGGAISNVDDWIGGAAAQINQQDFDLGRKIVTWNGSAGIPFRWSGTASLTSTQRTALDPNAVTAAATSSDILNYVRGDTSKQANHTPAGPYRSRSSVLGDIIHSTPVYWNDGTNKTVFVGANDGMLHAINAADGTERFAYIPALLIPKLSALTVTPYVHKYFVDGRLDVHKFTTTTGATTTSQTILAGSLGAGGRGLFALDVTDAVATTETDAATKVLWEITNTSTGFANLGYTYGAPTLLTLPDGTAALAIGNGYNNTSANNSTGNGHASLFLINAKTGALIQEFDTGSGSTTSPNGLSSPSFLDTNSDGKKDVAYAGDIDGNLWKFDLSATAANPYSATTARSATKLHTTNPAQAITMAPGMKAHPEGGTMVTFVTGRMLVDADKSDAATHYAYGIWDGAPATNTLFLTQTLTERTYTGSTPNIRVRTSTSNVPDWKKHMGWKTALPIGGERIVGDGALISNSVFVFMSTNPTISPAALPPGENWWMQLNAITGGDSNSILFDLNKDGKYSTLDQVDDSSGTTKLSPVGRHMGGGIRSQLIQLSSIGFDVYQSNYDKNGVPAPTVTTNTTTSTTAGRGVSNGHFDFDVYCKTNCKDGLNATAGTKYIGTDTKGYFYTHVHEYDDIYDVTGVDMLNPSQALQKLSRVKVNSTSTTSSIATSTTGPTIAECNQSSPATSYQYCNYASCSSWLSRYNHIRG
jgi:Tfp pilus tip-associated adhesin PilY1